MPLRVPPVARMRHPGSQFRPGVAIDELQDLLDHLRPWTDEDAVAARLRAWAARRDRPLSLSNKRGDGAADIALYLRALGTGSAALYLRAFGRVKEAEDAERSRLRFAIDNADPDSETVLGLVWNMLANVGRGRRAMDADRLGDHVVGLSAGSMRHYRRTYGEGALSAYLKRLQYRFDLAVLTQGDRSKAAARRWLEREQVAHQGHKTATDCLYCERARPVSTKTSPLAFVRRRRHTSKS